MIYLNKDQQRQPFGGHHFPEQGVVVRGKNLDEIIKKVYDLRIRNGHPLGDPSQDILRYYAEAFPYMVITDDAVYDTREDAMFVRFRHWIHTTWKNPPKKSVTRKEAAFRWEVCKTCPNNVEQSWTPTPESDELDRRAFMLRAGQDVPDYLGFCALHRWDLGAAVFLDTPDQFSAKEKTRENEARCWVGSLERSSR